MVAIVLVIPRAMRKSTDARTGGGGRYGRNQGLYMISSDLQKSTISELVREVALYERVPAGEEVDALIRDLGPHASVNLLKAALAVYEMKRITVLETALPLALGAAGLSQVTLEDGTSVSMEAFYSMQFGPPLATDEERDTAKDKFYAWLSDPARPRGFAGIVKERVTYGVHPQTLKAWTRRVVEEGLERPPESIATITAYKRAKIKTP